MATSVKAVVTQSVQMNGATFQAASVTLNGVNADIIEETVAASATNTVTGVAFPTGKMQLLYLLSDSVDCTIVLVGTGGNTSISLLAGIPYLWTTASGADPLGHYPITGMTIQNLATANGVANVVATDVHGRILLSA